MKVEKEDLVEPDLYDFMENMTAPDYFKFYLDENDILFEMIDEADITGKEYAKSNLIH